MSEPVPEHEASSLVAELTRRAETVATAESLTGGRLAVLLTDVPGASAVFAGGLVAYASEIKMALLDVPRSTVARVGVVSAETAEQMAVGARHRFATTYALSTTGVAGPEPQEGKPVGTVFVGFAGPNGAEAVAVECSGGRLAIQQQTCTAALNLLRSRLGA